ncbi:LysR family transcriptional regulator [Ramlibacter algicola]|uniref:LysR family transcriptional regulator n=1 Tax=Ramlibacter algicola TaxID=2795217 RepID=A0A934Q2F9_9BURK|nr:LysR family transcriptional regulator [Ramlibacter algicola]MBK0394910.1 LysR family transcriptional regulator [Ramlibacter algicola]
MDRLKAMGAFVRAVELGSLSAVAREMSTTQPTVSKLVAWLERDIGARLLERSSQRVLPTEEGARFLANAKRVLEEYEEAVAEVASGVREPRGLVRISAPVALGELRLGALMLEILSDLPHLQVELLLEDRFVDPVEERVDLTIRIGGVLPADLVARQLAVWPRYLVASPDYVRRRGRPRRPEDLAAHDYLRYAGRSDEEVRLTCADDSLVVNLPSRYRVNSAIALLNAVHSGAGIALQPCWMVDGALREGTLVRVLPRWTGPAQTAHLVYAPRRRLPARVQVVMERLLASIATW